MVMTARIVKARTLAIVLMTALVALVLSSGALYSTSESGGSGTVGPSDKGLETKPKLDVPYEPTAYEIVEEMLNLADVHREDLVYDLGCGDGRIVIMAAKERGAKGVGVDIDPERIKESVENARQAGVENQVTFLQQDLFKTDFRDGTVVMLYLWPEVNLRLRPKLFTDLKPGTRVVSHSHTMGDWKPDRTSEVLKHNLHFWVIPANVTGTWSWPMRANKKRMRAVLHLNQHFQEISGSLTIGSSTVPLANATVRGRDVRFSVESAIDGRKMTIEFDGRANGDAIRGKMVLSGGGSRSTAPWQARRDPSSRVSLDK
jgi:SAM-dependent methyltransferase